MHRSRLAFGLQRNLTAVCVGVSVCPSENCHFAEEFHDGDVVVKPASGSVLATFEIE